MVKTLDLTKSLMDYIEDILHEICLFFDPHRNISLSRLRQLKDEGGGQIEWNRLIVE